MLHFSSVFVLLIDSFSIHLKEVIEMKLFYRRNMYEKGSNNPFRNVEQSNGQLG